MLSVGECGSKLEISGIVRRSCIMKAGLPRLSRREWFSGASPRLAEFPTSVFAFDDKKVPGDKGKQTDDASECDSKSPHNYSFNCRKILLSNGATSNYAELDEEAPSVPKVKFMPSQTGETVSVSALPPTSNAALSNQSSRTEPYLEQRVSIEKFIHGCNLSDLENESPEKTLDRSNPRLQGDVAISKDCPTAGKLPELGENHALVEKAMSTTDFSVLEDITRKRESPKQFLNASNVASDRTEQASKEPDRTENLQLTPVGVGMSSKPKSPLRLTPNLHIKPTPTKIQPSPRRIPNPKAVDSPARRTRSATKCSVDEKQELGRESFKHLNSARLEDEKSANDETFGFVPENRSMESAQLGRKSFGSIASAQESMDERSPPPKRTHPASILSSRKKRNLALNEAKATRRIVAFGSPEAAEYHVGSPSVNLTPMPSSRAKALFAIPRGKDRDPSIKLASDCSASSSCERTVEIESDLNALVENLNGISPDLSPIGNDDDQDGTEHFDLQNDKYPCATGNFQEFSSAESVLSSPTSKRSLADKMQPGEQISEDIQTPSGQKLSLNDQVLSPLRLDQTQPQTNVGLNDSGFSGCSPSYTTKNSHIDGSKSFSMVAAETGESRTVELETDVNLLLRRTLGYAGTSDGTKECKSNASSPAESVEMTDTQTIASINSNNEKFSEETLFEVNGQRLDFTSQISDYFPVVTNFQGDQVEDGQTVELECDMTALLAAAGVRDIINEKSSFSFEENHDTSGLVTMLSQDQASYAGHGRSGKWKASEHSQNSETNKRSVLDCEGSPENAPHPVHRKSIDNRKCILAPSSRLSISVDGEILIDESDERIPPPEVDEKQDVKSNAPFGGSEQNINEEILTSTLKEMIESASSEIVALSAAHVVCNADDALVRFGNSVQEISNRLISKPLHRFLCAVCDEIESGTDEVLDSKLCVAATTNMKRNDLLILHRCWRSKTDSLVKKKMHLLSERLNRSVKYDWERWLSNVLSSMLQPVEEVSSDLLAQIEILENIIRANSGVQERFKKITNKSVQRARRKSWLRQSVRFLPCESFCRLHFKSYLFLFSFLSSTQHMASAFKAEISAIEAQLAQTQARLDATRKEARLIDDRLILHDRANSLKLAYSSHRPQAESGRRDFLALKGLHSWHPKSLQENELVFMFSGPASRCITLSLSMEGKSFKICNDSENRCSEIRFHTSTRKFIDEGISNEVELMGTCFEDTTRIGFCIQKIEWVLGRLDNTAREIERIRRRYRAELRRDEAEGPKFVLAVSFQSRLVKLRACFELSHSYPSTPLDVEFDLLDGNLDLDELRKFLVRNARTGFGNLSRTCDLIVGFLS